MGGVETKDQETTMIQPSSSFSFVFMPWMLKIMAYLVKWGDKSIATQTQSVPGDRGIPGGSGTQTVILPVGETPPELDIGSREHWGRLADDSTGNIWGNHVDADPRNRWWLGVLGYLYFRKPLHMETRSCVSSTSRCMYVNAWKSRRQGSTVQENSGRQQASTAHANSKLSQYNLDDLPPFNVDLDEFRFASF